MQKKNQDKRHTTNFVFLSFNFQLSNYFYFDEIDGPSLSSNCFFKRELWDILWVSLFLEVIGSSVNGGGGKFKFRIHLNIVCQGLLCVG